MKCLVGATSRASGEAPGGSESDMWERQMGAIGRSARLERQEGAIGGASCGSFWYELRVEILAGASGMSVQWECLVKVSLITSVESSPPFRYLHWVKDGYFAINRANCLTLYQLSLRIIRVRASPSSRSPFSLIVYRAQR